MLQEMGIGFEILSSTDKNSSLCVICLENVIPDQNDDVIEFQDMMMAPAAAEESSPKSFLLHEDLDVSSRTSTAPIVELSECKHRFCTACIHYWIIAQMQRGKFANSDLKCLFEKCPVELPQPLIQHCLTPQEFVELKRLKQLNDVYRNPDLLFCGNSHCDQVINKASWSQMKDVNFWGKVHCRSCGFETCVECGQEYHRDAKFPLQRCFFKSSSCDSKQLDDKFQQWKSKRPVKRCPACRRFIHKLKGCNHVTCACGYEFCWICGGKYSKKHFARWNVFGCPGLMFQETYGMPCSHLLLVQILFRLVFTLMLIALALLVVGFYIGVLFPLALGLFILSWLFCFPIFHLRLYGTALSIIERIVTFKDLRRFILQSD
jgi:hypothetical protein